MKSSREMTEDILVRRDEYVALRKKKIKMFTGSSISVLGFAIIVTGSMMLLNSGVMDQHVPIETNLSISISEEAPASQVPVKKETERIVNNSSEKISVKLSSGENPENTQPDIMPEAPLAVQVVLQVSDTPAGNSNKPNEMAVVPAVSTVPSFDTDVNIKGHDKESVSAGSSKSSVSSKESITQKSEEVLSSKESVQTIATSLSSESVVSESAVESAASSSDIVSDSVIITEPPVSDSGITVTDITGSVSLVEQVTDMTETSSYYVYYELTSDEEKDDTIFKDMDEIVFENKTYRSVPVTVDYEMAKYMEYLPSKAVINECEVYYVRKMHMIALVKNRNLALYSLWTEQDNNEE